ncbi:MAG: zinc-binding dehydrogenase, partial [Steroidobacteraceae bacterium]
VIEAASIWMQYFTALAIYEIAHATVGDYVIVRAASSSVGLAAIQLANWAGAIPIAATRTSAKTTALLTHGAKHVIATEESNLIAEVQRITNGKGARIVFDPVGGPDVDTLAQAASEDGIIIIYGGLSGRPTPYPHWPAAMKGLTLRGWVASAIWNKPERFARYRDLILYGLQEGRLKPVIAKGADRRRAPLPGIESTVRQDHRHGVGASPTCRPESPCTKLLRQWLQVSCSCRQPPVDPATSPNPPRPADRPNPRKAIRSERWSNVSISRRTKPRSKA